LRELYRNRVLVLMLLPAMIYFLINNYAPMIGIYYAFVQFEFNTSLFQMEFVGLKNFEFLWKSGKLVELTLNTIGYNLAFIVLGNVLSIAIAVLLSEIPGRGSRRRPSRSCFCPISSPSSS
jgi:putative aldouronate transport system permease protein